MIFASESAIDPVSLAALARKVGKRVSYVIAPSGQVVVGLRHWYARLRGKDYYAMLERAVAEKWLTQEQSESIWASFVSRQLLFAEILASLGSIDGASLKALLLRHERSVLPLGEFLVTENVVSQETLNRALEIQKELQPTLASLLAQAGLSQEQIQMLEAA